MNNDTYLRQLAEYRRVSKGLGDVSYYDMPPPWTNYPIQMETVALVTQNGEYVYDIHLEYQTPAGEWVYFLSPNVFSEEKEEM